MPSNEDASPPPTGREHRTRRIAVSRPIVWSFGIGCGLMVLGALIALLLYPYSTPAWSPTVGSLVILIGFFFLFGIPGALIALRHPWATALLRSVDQQFNHPRLIGLVWVWVGAVVPALFSALTVRDFSHEIVPPLDTAALVMLGPWLAVMLLDRRR